MVNCNLTFSHSDNTLSTKSTAPMEWFDKFINRLYSMWVVEGLNMSSTQCVEAFVPLSALALIFSSRGRFRGFWPHEAPLISTVRGMTHNSQISHKWTLINENIFMRLLIAISLLPHCWCHHRPTACYVFYSETQIMSLSQHANFVAVLTGR